MSTIQEISQAQSATATTSSASTSSAQDIMGKQDFLTLLVAQLQNQDPLNPDDPTEFTAQLAQFSSLEQLFNLNDSMKNLVTSNANSDKFATLQTIGKDVVYQGSKFEYDGEEPIELGYMLDGNASEVQITIQKDGATVATLDGTELNEGNHFVTWDGLNTDGDPAGSGSYSIAITAKAKEGESVAASPLLKSEVTGVDLTGDYGGQLLTKAGEVSFTAILGVYEKNTVDPASALKQTATSSARSSVNASNIIEQSAANEAAATADALDIKDDSLISFDLNFKQ